jgi:uncharacterized protein involved in outer membrane biogenesis
MRKTAVAVGVVLLVLVLSAAILPRLVSLETLRPRIVAAMEEKTGRKVGFSKLSLSLFPAIGVRIFDMTLSGDPGRAGENLLSVPEAEIRMAIVPLLTGRAEFTTFLLHRPQILFRLHANGTHSATEIANRLGRHEAPFPAGPPEKVSVAMRDIAVDRARLVIVLEGENGRENRWAVAPFALRLSGIGEARNTFEIRTRIDGSLRGEIELTGSAVHEAGPVADPSFFSLAAKGEVFGQPLRVEGRMSAPQGPAELDLTVAFPKIVLGKLREILSAPPVQLIDASPEGVAALVFKLSGTLAAMGVEGELDLTRAGWKVTPEIRKFIDLPCMVVFQGHRFPDTLLLSNAEISFPPLILIANASLVPSTGAREWSASARMASLADFSRSRGGGFSKWAPSGRLTVSGRGRRAAADAPEEWTAAIDVGDAGFQVPEKGLDIRSLNGHLEITPRSLSFLPLAGLLNGQRFVLNGQVARGPSASGHIDLRMAYLDADVLFPPAEGKGTPGTPGTAPPAAQGKKPEEQAIAVRGSFAIDAGKARNLEFRDLAGVVRYENGNLYFDAMRVKLYGGEVESSGRIRLGGPTPEFRLKLSAKKVAVGEIISRKTGLGNFLNGVASLSGEIAGEGGDFQAFARTAAGAGSVRVDGGKIRGTDIFGTAGGLAALPSFALVARGADGKAETSFSTLSADFRIGGGKIRTDNLRIAFDRAVLEGTAAVGFDRTFDFHGRLRLSRELSERVRETARRFPAGPSGQAEIPVLMSGPVTSPAVAIDSRDLSGETPPRRNQGGGK